MQVSGSPIPSVVGIICICLGLSGSILALVGPATNSPRPPYAVDGPLGEARLFAEGTISTDTDEFGASFTPDGKTVFYSKSVGHHNTYVICVSHFEHGAWQAPEVAPFSGQYWDFDPVVSPDGNRLFFASDRPVPGKQKEDNDFDIWVVEKTPNGWGEPKNLGVPVNSNADETFASVTVNGTLYFTSTREGGSAVFYRSKPVNGRYTAVEKLAGPLQTPANASFEVTIAPDESFLFFSPFRRVDGYGGLDLYVSFNRDGVWSEPKNLGPKVNTRARDYSARISPDGKYLFFSSERGFATAPLEKPLTFPEFQKHLGSVLNGWGNIYQIELEPLLRELREKP